MGVIGVSVVSGLCKWVGVCLDLSLLLLFLVVWLCKCFKVCQYPANVPRVPVPHVPVEGTSRQPGVPLLITAIQEAISGTSSHYESL